MARAIVTGASSGVGKAMAQRLDRDGHEVVLVARSTDALEELARSMTGARIVTADLADPEGAETVFSEAPGADILINNAGFGEFGPFASSDLSRAQAMIQVNCSSLTALTGKYLPAMLERGTGHIMNVASTAAFQPGPTMAVYYATKAYVLSFTEAVAEEVRGSGVSVTAFCPGAFASGFQATAHVEESRLVKGRKLPSAEEMAEAALRSMQRGEVVAVPGLANKVGAFMPRLTPRPIMRRVVSFIQREV